MFRDNPNPNRDIDLTVVRGIVSALLLTVTGTFVLLQQRVEVPDWVGNAITAGLAGLIGYLGNAVRNRGTVATENVENVHVQQLGEDHAAN